MTYTQGCFAECPYFADLREISFPEHPLLIKTHLKEVVGQRKQEALYIGVSTRMELS